MNGKVAANIRKNLEVKLRDIPLFEPKKNGKPSRHPRAIGTHSMSKSSVEGYITNMYWGEHDNVRLDAVIDILEQLEDAFDLATFYKTVQGLHDGTPDGYNAVIDEVLAFMVEPEKESKHDAA